MGLQSSKYPTLKSCVLVMTAFRLIVVGNMNFSIIYDHYYYSYRWTYCDNILE